MFIKLLTTLKKSELVIVTAVTASEPLEEIIEYAQQAVDNGDTSTLVYFTAGYKKGSSLTEFEDDLWEDILDPKLHALEKENGNED